MAIKTVTYTKDIRLSPHFMLHEFKCSASNIIKYCEETIAKLEKIFDTCLNVGEAIVESGYRTPEYSVKVGGTKDDGHTVGIAVDIKWYDKNEKLIAPKYIACIAQEIGFTGIGIMKNSIHLDTRTTKNYKNGKWWGDETKSKSGIADFYAYFGLTKDEVYKTLGIEQKKAEEPKNTEEKPIEVNPIEVKPVETVKPVENAEPPKVETAEDIIKENANIIVRFFEFLIKLFKKFKGE